MSIRYTLRHNIPADKLAAEDVNDSSTWDLDLLRKHELAETDNHDVVYRQHNGKVVNWAEAATQQSRLILNQIQEISEDVEDQLESTQQYLTEIEREASTLTQEAEETMEATQNTLLQAQLAASDASRNAEDCANSSVLSRNWAIKTDGKVVEGSTEVDYSSKYYAQQSSSFAQSSSNYATQAQTAKNTAVAAASTAAQDAVEDAEELLSGYVTSAQTSATTASNKATEAGGYASDAQQAKSDAISAKNSAIAAKDSATSSATVATTKASEAATSASNANTYSQNSAASANLSEEWATKITGTVDGTNYSSKYYAQQSQSIYDDMEEILDDYEISEFSSYEMQQIWDGTYVPVTPTDPSKEISASDMDNIWAQAG